MTIAELHFKLKELGIPEDKYYLHGFYGSTDDDNRLSLIIKRENTVLEYEVYYKERGEQHSKTIFTTEDAACQYVYKRLKMDKEIENEFYK